MDGIRRFRKVVLASVLFAGVCSASFSRIIYVDDDASGRADGSSWVNAYPYLQDALAAAGQGDEVRVAQGVYRPNQGASIQPQVPKRRAAIAVQATDPAGQYLAFQMKNGVAIMGGFAGLGAEDPNGRDVGRYETILSGDLHNNDVAGWGPENPLFQSLRVDNSLQVVASVNVDSTAVLDGFIIEAATNSTMLSDNASPHVANCTFKNNYADQRNGTTGSGFRCSGGKPSLSNCVFEGSSAYQGAAILTGATSLASPLPIRLTLSLSGCRFTGNWAADSGGAINSTVGDLLLTGCVFERNAAQRGGAIYLAAGTLTLTECTFEGNAASDGGGAVFVAQKVTAAMTRCVLKRNWAVNSGGAVRSEASLLTLSACTLSGNSAMYGGALHAYPARLPAGDSKVVLMQCLFTGNRGSSEGGALYIYRSVIESTISSCTFAYNRASRSSTLGGSDGRGRDPRVIMDNCIVWDGEGSISSLTSPPPRLPTAAVENEAVSVTYSDVQGGWPGVGNIDADPLFAAPGHWVDAADPKAVVEPSYAYPVWVDGDYHLKSQAGRWDPQGESWITDTVTSPCVDAGDPNTPVGDEPVPNGGRINLGAYGGTPEASMSPHTGP